MSFNYLKDGTWQTPTVKRRKGGQWVSTVATAGDMPGETLFHSPMDSQEELDRFHLVEQPDHVDIASDPAGENRNVARMFCPEDDLVSSAYMWGPNEAPDTGSTGENDPDAVYSRYHLYIPEDGALYNPDPDQGFSTKVPGISGKYDSGVAGGGTQADGRTWSARTYARPTVESESNTQFDYYYYVYHPDLSGDYGKLYQWDGSYDFGQWHEITMYVEMNTPGENDAILRGWINGDLAYEKTDFRFRNEDNPNVGVTRAHAAYTYWGGSWGSPTDQYVYFKDFTITDAT